MGKPSRIAWILLVLAIIGVLFYGLRHPRDGMLQGKPESVWVKEIVYGGGDAQVQHWRDFGLEGIGILTRALERGIRPQDRAYLVFYQRMPGGLQRLLPAPPNTYATRMSAAWVLERLKGDARPALPALKRSLKAERTSGVQLEVLSCFEHLLPGMSAGERAEVLPEFIKGAQSGDWGVRNNAARDLGLYQQQAAAVSPVLAQLLQDPQVQVRLVAAESLAKVDPSAAIKAGAVPMAIGLLKDKDYQIARLATELLGTMKLQPELAVPALVEIVQGTNYETGAAALYALGNFKAQADTILPVAEAALNHANGRMRYAAKYTVGRLQKGKK